MRQREKWRGSCRARRRGVARSRERAQTLLELVIAMSLLGIALQLTIKTQLWQMTTTQQIDRHRLALKALEARIAIDGKLGARGNARRSGARRHATDTPNDIEIHLAHLTAGLPSPDWKYTHDTIEGNGWTLCWDERTRKVDRFRDDQQYEVKGLSENRAEGIVDARRCESLALP